MLCGLESPWGESMEWLTKLIASVWRTEGRDRESPEWLKQYHKPFFRSRKQAEAYVADELGRALPQGWAFRKSPYKSLIWSIREEKFKCAELVGEDYTVRISKSLDLVIFEHGNSSAGCFGLHHVLLNALVIDAVMLQEFPLGVCVKSLLANRTPNEWCAT